MEHVQCAFPIVANSQSYKSTFSFDIDIRFLICSEISFLSSLFSFDCVLVTKNYLFGATCSFRMERNRFISLIACTYLIQSRAVFKVNGTHCNLTRIRLFLGHIFFVVVSLTGLSTPGNIMVQSFDTWFTCYYSFVSIWIFPLLVLLTGFWSVLSSTHVSSTDCIDIVMKSHVS